jgi:hypothetical protein
MINPTKLRTESLQQNSEMNRACTAWHTSPKSRSDPSPSSCSVARHPLQRKLSRNKLIIILQSTTITTSVSATLLQKTMPLHVHCNMLFKQDMHLAHWLNHSKVRHWQFTVHQCQQFTVHSTPCQHITWEQRLKEHLLGWAVVQVWRLLLSEASANVSTFHAFSWNTIANKLKEYDGNKWHW